MPLPPLAGLGERRVPAEVALRWQGIVLSAGGDGLMAVDVNAGASFSAGIPHPLFQVGQGLGGWAVSAYGQRFLISSDEQIESDSPIIVVQNWWAALRK
jgi:hypothetical protein